MPSDKKIVAVPPQTGHGRQWKRSKSQWGLVCCEAKQKKKDPVVVVYCGIFSLKGLRHVTSCGRAPSRSSRDMPSCTLSCCALGEAVKARGEPCVSYVLLRGSERLLRALWIGSS